MLNYHIGRFALSSLCVGDLVRLGLSSARVAGGEKISHFHRSFSRKRNKNLTYQFLRDTTNFQLVQVLVLRSDCCLQFVDRKLRGLVINKAEIFRNAKVRTSYLRSYEFIGGNSIAFYSDSPEYGGNKSLRKLVHIHQSTGRNILEQWKLQQHCCGKLQYLRRIEFATELLWESTMT